MSCNHEWSKECYDVVPSQVCGRCNAFQVEEEHAELVRERDEARREADRFRHGCTVEGDFVCPNEYAVSELTAERNFLRALKKNHEEDFTRVCKERDEALAKYQWMVDRACDEKLDGYRELGAKCAQLEEERDEAQEAYREARASRWHVSKKWDEALKEIERLRTENEDMGRALNEARAEVEKLSESAKAAWEAECVMREQRDRYHAEWKQERQEVERLRAEAAPMNEHFNAGYRDGARDAYRRGAEAMREAVDKVVCTKGIWDSSRLSARIEALPIPEET